MGNVSGVIFLLHLRGKINGAKVISKILKDRYGDDNYIYDVASQYGSSGGWYLIFLKFLESLSFVFGIIQLLLAHRSSAIYFSFTTNGLAYKRDLFLSIILLVLKRNLILHFHSSDEDSLKNSFFFGLISRRCTCIFVNESQKKRFADYFGPHIKRWFVLSNKIMMKNEVAFRHCNYLSRKNKEYFTFFALSNYIDGKGLDLCVKCFYELTKNNNETDRVPKLVLAGEIIDDGYYKKIKKLVNELSLVGSVEIRGYVSGDEKEDLFNSSDVFLFSSQMVETFGIVVLEALTHGLPIISYRNDAIPEMIEDGRNGFIVSSAEGFLQSMSKLMNDDSLKERMSVRSFDKSKDFSIINFYKDFENIVYETVT